MPVNEEKSMRKKLSPEAKSFATKSRVVPEARVAPLASFNAHVISPAAGARKTATFGPCCR